MTALAPEPTLKPTRAFKQLDVDQVETTIEKLATRISQRFPDSGLFHVSLQLLDIARLTAKRTEEIAKPHFLLRLAISLLLGVIGAGLLILPLTLELPTGSVSLTEFVQVLEAGINDLVLIGAAIFFLVTLEDRLKRRKALQAIHELRSLAHIIDMHQLTKDPQHYFAGLPASATRPELSQFLLGRYLDYCSELLSLVGKVAALYVQHFEDAVAIAAVNEVEELTTGLSGKIWQKLVILSSIKQVEAETHKIGA